MELLKKEQQILVLSGNKDVESNFKNELIGYGNVTFEILEKFNEDAQGIFEAVLSDIKPGTKNVDELLTAIHRKVKPGGLFLIRDLSNEEAEKLEFALRTNGFINVTTQKIDSSNEVQSYKPNYAVGSSAKLNFSKKATTPAVWKLDDTLDDEVETIDPDDLLDEDDFKKPDEASLRVCGTTGKRKACKDCSCGLAEELDAESAAVTKPINSAEAKSSCGSCYLGDAFRCASCPYVGMPAFKPGEKVQLSDGLLKADA